VAEGEIATHGNVEIARLTINWPFPRVEPRLLCLYIRPTMTKRRRQITNNRILRIRRDDSGGVLPMIVSTSARVSAKPE
jgi:hypothetical protein